MTAELVELSTSAYQPNRCYPRPHVDGRWTVVFWTGSEMRTLNTYTGRNAAADASDRARRLNRRLGK